MRSSILAVVLVVLACSLSVHAQPCQRSHMEMSSRVAEESALLDLAQQPLGAAVCARQCLTYNSPKKGPVNVWFQCQGAACDDCSHLTPASIAYCDDPNTQSNVGGETVANKNAYAAANGLDQTKQLAADINNNGWVICSTPTQVSCFESPPVPGLTAQFRQLNAVASAPRNHIKITKCVVIKGQKACGTWRHPTNTPAPKTPAKKAAPKKAPAKKAAAKKKATKKTVPKKKKVAKKVTKKTNKKSAAKPKKATKKKATKKKAAPKKKSTKKATKKKTIKKATKKKPAKKSAKKPAKRAAKKKPAKKAAKKKPAKKGPSAATTKAVAGLKKKLAAEQKAAAAATKQGNHATAHDHQVAANKISAQIKALLAHH